MALPTQKITDIKTAILAEFDGETHIAFGTDNSPESSGDTALGVEVIRKAFDEASIKNIPAGTYDFSATIPLTEGNSSTYAEIGLFNDPSAGSMASRKLLTNTVAKTSSIELSVGLQIDVTITN